MDQFLEVLETMRSGEASVERLFRGDGVAMRAHSIRRNPMYPKMLAEAAKFVAEIVKGRRPMHQLQEAMTTSDFPLLFGDILDRQVLAGYQEAPSTWRNYVKVSTVRDFRTVKRYAVSGAEAVLDEVKEDQQYPVGKLDESALWEYRVKKHGRKLQFSFEVIVNDDLESLTDAPQRLGKAARRTEQRFVTTLYVDANGPHASFYSVGNANIITGNPALSLAGLQTGLAQLSSRVDSDGEPIVIEMVELVVPPALEITAQNILNALQIELTERGGTSGTKLVSQNWMKTRFRLNVDPYIPIIASTANGNTSWFLFGNPDAGRPALEVGFLRGYEEPQVFMKQPNAVRVGGGAPDTFDFDTDSREYKLRHILGGTRADPKMTAASNGSGS